MSKIKKIVTNLLGAQVAEVSSVPKGLPLESMTNDTISLLFYYQRMLALATNVQGTIVECGVGGGMTMLMFAALVKAEARQRKIWGFDSFEGFPEPTKDDDSPRAPKKGEWNHTSIERINAKLRAGGFDQQFVTSQVTLIKGFFEESLVKYRGGPIALLHLDVDLYGSYKTCLDSLYSQVAEGGVVVFDEYLSTMEHLKWPGAAKAIDEFFTPEQISRDSLTGKYYHIKGAQKA